MLAGLVRQAYYINSEAYSTRRHGMETALAEAGIPVERWAAVTGGPALLASHAQHLQRVHCAGQPFCASSSTISSSHPVASAIACLPFETIPITCMAIFNRSVGGLGGGWVSK